MIAVLPSTRGRPLSFALMHFASARADSMSSCRDRSMTNSDLGTEVLVLLAAAPAPVATADLASIDLGAVVSLIVSFRASTIQLRLTYHTGPHHLRLPAFSRHGGASPIPRKTCGHDARVRAGSSLPLNNP